MPTSKKKDRPVIQPRAYDGVVGVSSLSLLDEAGQPVDLRLVVGGHVISTGNPDCNSCTNGMCGGGGDSCPKMT